MTQLHAHYNGAHPDEQVSIDVYARIADDLCEEEEVEDIVPRGYDHNVCAVCECHITALHDLRLKMLLSKKAALQGCSRLAPDLASSDACHAPVAPTSHPIYIPGCRLGGAGVSVAVRERSDPDRAGHAP